MRPAGGKNDEKVEPRNVTMYPDHWATVDEYAQAEGFTVSLALRKIVVEWAELKERMLVDAKPQYSVKS